MTAAAALLLLTAPDPATARLLAELAAVEAAYAHVEADYRIRHNSPGQPEPPAQGYVGSWGVGAVYRTTPPAGHPTAAVVNPGYTAQLSRLPWAGWFVTSIGRPGATFGPGLVASEPGSPAGEFVPPPHAPAGLFYRRPFRDIVLSRTGPAVVEAGVRDGRAVRTAIVPLPSPGPRRLTLTLTADPPAVVLDARLDTPGGTGDGDVWGTIEYHAAAGCWPGVRRTRVASTHRPYSRDTALATSETVVEFSRYRRLVAPPPADRFTFAALGLPEPEVPELTTNSPLPPDPDAPPPPPVAEPPGPPDESWQWWAIGGIVLAGAVAFMRVGRRPG